MKRGNGLRRKTPLTTKTPLARGAASLPRTGPLRRCGRLNPRSARTAAIYRSERVPLVKRLLAENPTCQIRWDSGCTMVATDVDEIVGRGRGGDFLDPENCQTACRHCHTMKTDNPAEAMRRGFSRRRAA